MQNSYLNDILGSYYESRFSDLYNYSYDNDMANSNFADADDSSKSYWVLENYDSCLRE